MNRTKQQGAVLFIALIMLLVLTVLAVSSMRGVTLESKITGSRAHMERAQHLADAALREAEFRFSPAQELRSDMIESSDTLMARNCVKDNTLNRYGNNRPCLLKPITDESELIALFDTPLTYLKNSSYTNNTGAKAKDAGNSAVVAWMPYRGLDSDPAYQIENSGAWWHLYYIETDETDPTAVMRGDGGHWYLVNAQTEDEIAAQSIAYVYFVGPK